jgi:hypothetical protein
MQSFSSLLAQILNIIPRGQFAQLVAEHQSERHARGFTSWQQLVSMLFCHLGRAQSLREIEYGLRSASGKLNHLGVDAPSRSTLSYANAHRTWRLFEDLFYVVLERCRSAQPGKHRMRFKNPLFSIDSTTVELVSEMYSWAKYNKTKGAIKLHLMLDHDGYLPSFAVVTDGKSADITVARTFQFDPGSVVVFDRGYIDYAWFRTLTERGVWFVTRLKKNAHFTVVETRKPPKGVISDQVVDVFDTRRTLRGGFVPLRLRRIEVDDQKGGILVIYSNHLTFGATTISRIYKERWQIELFFKALKQNLKIKTFIGTSMNAIQVQLWTALISILIIRYLKRKSATAVSLSNLIAMLRFHLFAYRELWSWLQSPFEPPSPPSPLQLSLI